MEKLTVSILTGSEEPVQPRHQDALDATVGVSILTGSEEPVQPSSSSSKRRRKCFNPHRLRRAGAT